MPGNSKHMARRALALLFGLGAALCACDAPAPEAAAPPVRGGTIVVALAQEPESLMPYGTTSAAAEDVKSFLFNMLATTNADFGSFHPEVARAWEWSDDRRQLVMHLRNDVEWSDGVPVTAEDVAFSYQVARDSLVGWSTRAWKRHVTACEVVDRHTVRFRFDTVSFDQFRFAKEGWLVPKHLLQAVPRAEWRQHGFGRAPIGSGPFVLERWEAGQRIVLVRNERYFGRPKPWLDRIVFEIVPEASTRVERLRAGSVDLVALEPRQAASLRQDAAEGKTNVRVLNVRGRGCDFIGYNPAEPLLASRTVREALTRAIDRRAIIDALCFGFADIFEGPFAPLLWAYDSSRAPTPYDPQGAKRLLASEGWEDRDGDGWLDREGRKFEFTLTTNADNALRMQAIVPVQAYWKAIGVKVQIQALEMQTALGLRAERRYQAYFGGWNAGLSPSGTIESLWSCSSRGGRSNFVDFCHPEVDSLNIRMAAAVTPAAAVPFAHRIQALITAEHPYTWMYNEHTLVGVAARVQGVTADPRGAYVDMDNWSVQETAR